MRIFKKREDHASLETLSEYLDGRLSATDSQRVEQHVELCSRCREELSSLELTVGLLRRAPTVAPRRSFTLREAPAGAPARTGVRAPAWAYGAAASVAVVLFALVLSADLSGTLSREVSAPGETRLAAPAEPVPQPVLEVAVTREVEKRAAESEVALGAKVTSLQIAAAAVEVEAAAAPSSEEVPQEASISTPAPQVDLRSAPEAAELEQEALPGPMPETPEKFEALSSPEDAEEQEALPGPTPETPEEFEVLSSPEDAEEEEALPGPTPDSPEEFEVLSSTGDRDEGTAIVWRVLEGVFGGVAVALVAAIFWRIRRRRRLAIL